MQGLKYPLKWLKQVCTKKLNSSMLEMNDNELLIELAARFKKNREDLEAKNLLLKDLEKLNAKLLRSEKVKSEFLSNIRNEIINPLSSILGLSAMVAKGDDVEAAKKHAKLINEEAFKLNFQLHNIFIAAELEAGKTALEISMVKLAHIAAMVIKDFQNWALKKNIKISIVNHSQKEAGIYSDAEKLSTILANLIANAIEFSNTNSEVIVETSNRTIKVIDKGIGISNTHQKIIFDRFVQLNSGSTKNYAGHGLGLAVVKDLCDVIGATITLQSEEGKGTVFSLELKELNPQDTEANAVNGNDFLFTNDDEGMIF